MKHGGLPALLLLAALVGWSEPVSLCLLAGHQTYLVVQPGLELVVILLPLLTKW